MRNNKVAIIVGAFGQDGSYLAELLYSKGYTVIGIIQKKRKLENIRQLPFMYAYSQIEKINIESKKEVEALLIRLVPTEIYYLATTNECPLEFKYYDATLSVNSRSLAIILEVIANNLKNQTKIFYAASCNVFMGGAESPQNENTIIKPMTLYGLSKANGMSLVNMYRIKYGVFASSGILYNHESIRRSPVFLPRKVSQAVANIALGIQDSLFLENISSVRDWGHAKDYVRAMWMILQATTSDDFIISTGVARTVRDLVEVAFSIVDLDYNKYVTFKKLDPIMQTSLIGDNRKIKEVIGWQPEIKFEQLIEELVKHDKELARMQKKDNKWVMQS